ncbi:MAG: response regulator [Aliifodinibius sp.]|nr:response regulator [Fodinibius sp.]NIV14844.1 response regulator [Fodinibius sp.]NIY28723.1 response regulator [Fodinibius sp.]
MDSDIRMPKMKRAMFFVALLCIIVSTSFGCTQFSTTEPPRAAKGVLDLSDWSFEKGGPVDLSGEYEFYWQKHIPPKRFHQPNLPEKSGFIDVPEYWGGYELNGTEVSGTGYATYRLIIYLPELFASKLAFKFLDMGTAYEVYVNGEEILSVGAAGETKVTTTPRYLPQVVEFTPDSAQIELIYHVSNFHHQDGGAWEVIRLGTAEQMRTARETRLAFDLVLFGGILVIGLYHLALFRLRKKQKSFFFFGLFCILIAIRLLTTVERYLMHLAPEINWELFVKIEYLSYYLGVPVFTIFIYLLFSEDIHKIAVYIIGGVTALFSAVVLVTPASIFTHTLTPFNLFTSASMIYGFSMLMISAFRKREGAKIVLIGSLFLFLAVVNDMLDASGVLQTGHFVQLGLFIFIFSQAYLLSFRYSKAFRTIELQREELKNEIAERKRAEKEKEQLQERLARSQRMEAFGTLAGGVAHDLNNILSGVVTYPDLLLMDLSEESPLREPLETIRDSGLKAASVVQNLLTLARQGVLHFETLNLNELITDYLLSPECKKLMEDYPEVEIETSLDPNLLNINGSPFHLRKTITNLVTNAADAHEREGVVHIMTTNRYVDKPIKGYEEIKEGNYAVLRIEDNGMPISLEDLKQIFEPFYTRKVLGRSGSGLGMAVVWGAVHDHNGFIDAESKKGDGTAFELYFQVSEEECTRENVSVPIEEYMGHGESILVVDDVQEQRDIARKILERLGYRVTAFASGEDAVEYLRNNSADLVILDMIMDLGIDGLETYERIIELHPGIKAIIASGYAETERVKQAQKLGAGSYVKKPYTLEKIGLAVKAELIQ